MTEQRPSQSASHDAPARATRQEGDRSRAYSLVPRPPLRAEHPALVDVAFRSITLDLQPCCGSTVAHLLSVNKLAAPARAGRLGRRLITGRVGVLPAPDEIRLSRVAKGRDALT